MSGITTHVLDTSRGRPAGGVPVTLEVETVGGWKTLGEGITNADGRIADLLDGDATIDAGIYRLTFDTATYFADNKIQSFYPQVSVVFKIEDPNQHYHVPLLLSPFGYSTYRGS
jgi:5-hydroxyisourate hydrolase